MESFLLVLLLMSDFSSSFAKAYKGIKLEKDKNSKEEQPVKTQDNEINPFWKVFPAIGQGSDLATTLYAKDKGLVESNPILGNNAVIAGSKAGMGLLGYYLTKKLEKEHPKAAKAVSSIIGFGGLVPAGMNLRTISNAKKTR